MEPSDPIALFQRSTRASPRSPALRVEGRTYAYADLDRWSDAIAHALREGGAGHERVAFIGERTASSYAIILGILKAGCSFVPLHPDGPEARWRAMLARCDARYFIGAHAPREGLQVIAVPASDANVPAFSVVADKEREAYVMFTSGSTGGPKGVSVSRGNLAAYLHHIRSNCAFRPGDRFSQLFALTFDLSLHDLFVCWAAGACLCVPSDANALRTSAYIRDEGITVWFSVPSLPVLMHRMRSLAPGSLPSIRHAFFCGEALSYETARAFHAAAPEARLTNLYGPTETTIAVTSFEIDPASSTTNTTVPIGRPFTGSTARVVDGELLISGPQVAIGYIEDPAANERAFGQLPGSSQRWYRTGDRVREAEDGTLHYLGRVDDQVKVLGHRVEPGEVDAVIGPLLNGGRSVTIPVFEAGATRLATFVDVRADTDALLTRCREVLPDHMVPVWIRQLDHWPLTAHGKTDRQELIAMASA